jgi:GDPmannose 4,6-dehydratase
MWRMLQQETPDDYVLATGKTQTVRKFVELSFAEIGVTLNWQGSGVDEKGLCNKTGKTLVEIDPRYFRPTEVDLLLGDASKAKAKLGWEATTSLDQLVKEMMASDLKEAAKAGTPHKAE